MATQQQEEHQEEYQKAHFKATAPSIQTITGCSQEAADTFWKMRENNLDIQKLYSIYTLQNCIECIEINPDIWTTFSYDE